MKLTSLLQLDSKLPQAGKIDNLQQACAVFGCVHVNAEIRHFEQRAEPDNLN